MRDCFVDADLSDDASTAEGRLRDAGGERAPERFPRRRSPITKTAERLAGDMVAMARRIDRFLADDRVRQQRDVLRPILCKAISVLEYVGQYHLDVTLTLGDGAYAEWVDREIEGGTWLGQVVA